MFTRLYKALRFSLLHQKAGKLFNKQQYKESLKIINQISQMDVSKSIMAGLIISKGNIFGKMGRDKEAIEQYDDFIQNHVQDVKLEQDRSYMHAYALFLRDHAAQRLDSSQPITISKQQVLVLGEKASMLTRGDFTL